MTGEKSEGLSPFLESSFLSSASTPNALTTLDAQKHMMKLRMAQQTKRFVALAEQEAQEEEALTQLASRLTQSYRRESARSASILSQAKAFEDHLKHGEAAKAEPESSLKVQRAKETVSGSNFHVAYESLGEDEQMKVREAVEDAWKAIEEQVSSWKSCGETISSVIEKRANSVYMKLDEKDEEEGGMSLSTMTRSQQQKRSQSSHHQEASIDLSTMVSEYKAKIEEIYERMKEWNRQTQEGASLSNLSNSSSNSSSNSCSNSSSYSLRKSHKSSNSENIENRRKTSSSSTSSSSSMTPMHLDPIKERVSSWISQHEQYVKSVRSVKEEMRSSTIPQAHESLDTLKAQIAIATASSQYDLHLQSLLQSDLVEPRNGSFSSSSNASNTLNASNATNTSFNINSSNINSNNMNQSSSNSSRFSGVLIPPTPIRPLAPTTSKSSSATATAATAGETPSTNRKRRNIAPSFPLVGDSMPTPQRSANGGSYNTTSSNPLLATPSSQKASSSSLSLLLQTPSLSRRQSSESFNADAWLQEDEESTLSENGLSGAMEKNRKNGSSSMSLPDIRLAYDHLDASPSSQQEETTLQSASSPYSNLASRSFSSSPRQSPHQSSPLLSSTPSSFIRLNASLSGGNGSVGGRSRSAGRISSSSSSRSSPSSIDHASPLSTSNASLDRSSHAPSNRSTPASSNGRFTPMRPIEMPFLSPNTASQGMSQSSSPATQGLAHRLSLSPQISSSLPLEADKQSLIMEELAEHIIDIMSEANESEADSKKRRGEVEKYTKQILAIRSPSPSPVSSSPSTRRQAHHQKDSSQEEPRTEVRRRGGVRQKKETRLDAKRLSSSPNPPQSFGLSNAFTMAAEHGRKRESVAELPDINLHLDQLLSNSPSSSFTLENEDCDGFYEDEFAELEAAIGFEAVAKRQSSSQSLSPQSHSPISQSILDTSRGSPSHASRHIDRRRRAAVSCSSNAFSLAEKTSSLDISVSLLESQLAQLEDQQEDGEIDSYAHEDEHVSYLAENDSSTIIIHDNDVDEDVDEELEAELARLAAEEGCEAIDDFCDPEGEYNETFEDTIDTTNVEGDEGQVDDFDADQDEIQGDDFEALSHDEDDGDRFQSAESSTEELNDDDQDEELLLELERMEREKSSLSPASSSSYDPLNASFDLLHDDEPIEDGDFQLTGEGGLQATEETLFEEAPSRPSSPSHHLTTETLDETYIGNEFDTVNALSDDEGTEQDEEDDLLSSLPLPSLQLPHLSQHEVDVDHSMDDLSMNDCSIGAESTSSSQHDSSSSSSGRKSISSTSSVSSLLQLRGGAKTNAKTVFSLEPLLFNYPTPSKQQDSFMPLSSSESSSPASIEDVTSSQVNILPSLTPLATKALLESPISVIGSSSSLTSNRTKIVVSSSSIKPSSSILSFSSNSSFARFTLDSPSASPTASPSTASVVDSQESLELLPIAQDLEEDLDVSSQIHSSDPLPSSTSPSDDTIASFGSSYKFDTSFLQDDFKQLGLNESIVEDDLEDVIVAAEEDGDDSTYSPHSKPRGGVNRLNLSINPDEDVNNTSVSSSSPGFERIKKVLLFDQ